MHEVQAWLFIKHVAVDGRYLDAALAQRLENGIHLFSSQNKISGNCSFSAASRLEIDPGRNTQRSARYQRHPALRDRIATGHPKLVNATIELPLDAHNLIELRRI